MKKIPDILQDCLSLCGGREAWGQTLYLMRRERLFAAIYIAGTAVAIASALMVANILHLRMGSFYPSVHRDRTVYVDANFEDAQGYYLGYGFSRLAVEEMFGRLRCAELVCALVRDGYVYDFKACAEVGKQEVPVHPKFTDPDFFRLYPFRFVAGGAYTEESMEHGDRCVVITEDLARRLSLGNLNDGETGGIVGSTILLNYLPYRVIGVVRAASSLLMDCSADVYMPYTVPDSREGYQNERVSYVGGLQVRVLLKRGYGHEDLREELEVLWAKYDAMRKSARAEEIKWRLFVDPHWAKTLNFIDSNRTTMSLLLNLALPALLMLLFLLLPAINLSGMVSNRMEGRLAEMGVRKAFGANRGVLLRQVIQENLVLTLLGGLAGYVLSWLIIAAIRNHPMFLAMFERDGEPVHQVSLQLDMFLSPSMFLIAFVCCAVLNLMAALMPAWKSLKKPIVESLNQKK